MSHAALKIIEAGLQSSLRDLGRKTYGHLGVSESGALDGWTVQLCNALVGNALDTPVIELSGNRMRFRAICPVVISIGSYHATVHLNGLPLEYGLWTALPLTKNDEITLQTPFWSTRHYLALKGGFDLLKIMESVSVDPNAGIGEVLHKDNALKTPAIDCNDVSKFTDTLKKIAQPLVLDNTLRCIRGPEYTALDPKLQHQLWNQPLQILEQSSRMGYRLSTLTETHPRSVFRHEFIADSLRSHAVFPGIIQMPPDGQPIILLADCGSTGGYARVAKVIDADLWKLAHIPFGETIQLVEVDEYSALEALKYNNVHAQRIAIAAKHSLSNHP